MRSLFSMAILAGLVLLAGPGRAQWKFTALVPNTSSLNTPTAMAVAPSGRIFLTERFVNDPKQNPAYWANIRIWDPAQGLLAQPFVRITAFDARNERGLLGIALDPEYPSQPYVYVSYNYEVTTGPNPGSFLRIVRYTDKAGQGAYPVTIAEGIPATYGHNGGYLAFGPDKKLYTIIGDVWQPQNAQDTQPNNWNGKCIRLERDGTIPQDNPFGPNNPHFTLGHRNSFGHAFHPLTGQLFMSENGPLSNDEINVLEPGKNYGWPNELGNQNKPGYAKPIQTWSPTIGPVGVEFYRGSVYPSEYFGTLWVCDFNKGQLRVLFLEGDEVSPKVLREELVNDTSVGSLCDVKMGLDGRMYALSQFGNQIYRVDWTGKAPVMPDLLHVGTPRIGTTTWLVQRSGVGVSGEWMLVFLGTPLQPPVPTPWGVLQLTPVIDFLFGTSDRHGVVGVPLVWPKAPGLKGLRVSYQSVALDGGFRGLRLVSTRVDLRVE